MRFVLLLIPLLFLSCTTDNSVNDESNIQTKNQNFKVTENSVITGTFTGKFQTAFDGRRIVIDPVLDDIAFYDESGDAIQIMWTHEGLGIGGSIYVYGTSNNITVESGSINADYFKPDLGYKSSNGNIGATYEDTWTDIEGVIHKNVYENGLLIHKYKNNNKIF